MILVGVMGGSKVGSTVHQRYHKHFWYLKRILQVSRSMLDMLIPTMLETSTNAGLQRDMCSHCLKYR